MRRKIKEVAGVEITVRRNGEEIKFSLKENESLMDGLLREGFYINAVCGGNGGCGKCKVLVVEGEAIVTAEDEKCFSKEELDGGWRLACRLYPTGNLKISYDSYDESAFEVVSEFLKPNGGMGHSQVCMSHGACDVAVDIGTTTIVFQLLDRASGDILGTSTAINNQRKYGADVISRMQASVEGKKKELQESIQSDLRDGITALLKECGRVPEQIAEIVISCNTTMSHLLMGYDCDSLGTYPFTPVNIDFIRGEAREILEWNYDTKVILLPGISTYVGGDIVSGMYACDFHESEDICLIVDLGTNGEMALGNREKILVASAAAGPAFEGGNITWGMGSVPGAICSVKLENVDAVKIETIRGESPIGICGTGVVESVAEMLQKEVLDETGLLREEYFEEGFPLAITADGKSIVLTQKDVRELQMAKAAIRAGVESLLLRYGISGEQVSKVYLAGGFGYNLDVTKAITMGMLPAEFADKTRAVGNSSLAGAVKYLQSGGTDEALKGLIGVSEEILLSLDEDFNEIYMESINLR